MKYFIVIVLVSLWMPNLLHAKCWRSDQMTPVFCGEVRLTQEPKDCVAEAKIITMMVPYSNVQNLEYLEALKTKKLVIMLAQNACKSAHRKAALHGAFAGYCNDNADDLARRIDISFLGAGMVQIDRHGTSESLTCDRVK